MLAEWTSKILSLSLSPANGSHCQQLLNAGDSNCGQRGLAWQIFNAQENVISSVLKRLRKQLASCHGHGACGKVTILTNQVDRKGLRRGLAEYTTGQIG